MTPRRRDTPPGPTEATLLADDLRARILRGELAPAAPLREEVIAHDSGLSRHTVRTALARLVAERLASQVPYRGIRVASFSDQDLLALQELRSALEAEAVRLVRARHGDRWPDDVRAPIEAALRELQDVAGASPDDWPRLATAHAAVHRSIVAASNSARIIETYAQLDSEMLLLLVNMEPDYTAEELVTEHSAYFEAVQVDGEAEVRRFLSYGAERIRAPASGPAHGPRSIG